MLEVDLILIKRRGEDLTEAQEALAVWCADQGVPFPCFDDLRGAMATLRGWGVLRSSIAQ